MSKKQKKGRRYRFYASKFEETVARTMRDDGMEFEYEKLAIDYLKVHTYKPDFILPNGIVVEVKGRFRPEDRTKHILVRKQHPEWDIRFVFMRDNRLSPKSRTTYSKWCEARGFKYAFGKVPVEWYHEKLKSGD